MEILSTDLAKELKENYLLYSYSTFNRAIPSVVDGLKTAQRRILLGVQDLGLTYSGSYKKVSRLEGQVLGSYHPQGGCSGTAINMGQADTFRYPLTDIHGNVGGSIQVGAGIGKTISEDPPAAARYLEVRSTQITDEVYLKGLNKHSHDWIDNYDGSTQEVKYFVPSLPMLLINGGTGIATGYACHHVSYNISEVIAATQAWIKNKKLTVSNLLTKKIVTGPDLPNGARIFDENLEEIISLGHGTLKVCGTWKNKTVSWGKKSKRDAIIITSLATGSSEKFLEKIKKAVEDEKIMGVQDVSDLSSREGIEIMVVLKNGVNRNDVLNALFQYTNLFDTIGVNATALKTLGGSTCEFPRQMGFLEVITHWFDARKDCLIRQFDYNRRVCQDKLEIVRGFIILSNNIDKAIKTIRGSDEISDARDGLIKAFKLSLPQANAILNCSLNKLVKTEKDKLLLEEQYLLTQIAEYTELIDKNDQLEKYILTELSQLKKLFKDERRSEVIKPPTASVTKSTATVTTATTKAEPKKLSLKDKLKAEGRALKIPLKVINSFFESCIKDGKSIQKEWKDFSQGYYEFTVPDGKRQRRARLVELKKLAQDAGMPSRGKHGWNAFMESRAQKTLSQIEVDLKQLYDKIKLKPVKD